MFVSPGVRTPVLPVGRLACVCVHTRGTRQSGYKSLTKPPHSPHSTPPPPTVFGDHRPDVCPSPSAFPRTHTRHVGSRGAQRPARVPAERALQRHGCVLGEPAAVLPTLSGPICGHSTTCPGSRLSNIRVFPVWGWGNRAAPGDGWVSALDRTKTQTKGSGRRRRHSRPEPRRRKENSGRAEKEPAGTWEEAA
ncbi:hypothetical protein HJG60_012152 [Phyllostomus discolor]|uniref:Uncharacterized protein n=1 Tax=Phyllostomus discolor TaxID=89673 RepID=A0A834DT80_9CHIR|nr:hypothetical protein HJG60_012152 [Phyllostomus discolor]